MSTNNPRHIIRAVHALENNPRKMPLYHRHGVGEGGRHLGAVRPVYECLECNQIFCVPTDEDPTRAERCHCHCES